MAGFRKAKAEQAALKMSMYGPPGSGKTFTALLIGEGLAKRSGKRMAYVDTERGTDFYAQEVPSRSVHPTAFDFDALYTRSITEVNARLQELDPEQYSVVVIDSITHLWEAAKAAYQGRTNNAGQIPFHAWGKIKEPYKKLMQWMLNSPIHVIILGRQGNDFGENEDGELIAKGFKMKAEGETAYEPHICIRLEAEKNTKKKESIILACVEKDRSGVLAGKVIPWPCFANIAEPLLPLLGKTQAKVQSEEDAAGQDAEALVAQDHDKAAQSAALLKRMLAQIELADNDESLKKVGAEMTPELKRTMLAEHVQQVRDEYLSKQNQLAKAKPAKPGRNGTPPQEYNGRGEAKKTTLATPGQVAEIKALFDRLAWDLAGQQEYLANYDADYPEALLSEPATDLLRDLREKADRSNRKEVA